MFIVTRTKTIAVENDDGDLVAVKTLESAHVEYDTEVMQDQIKLGDHRLTGVRIFHLGVDDEGVPAIGTEVST